MNPIHKQLVSRQPLRRIHSSDGMQLYLDRMRLSGKAEYLGWFLSSLKIIPTNHQRLNSWQKCSTLTFTMMVLFVWIFYRICGPLSTTSPVFSHQSSHCSVTLTPSHPQTTKPLKCTPRITKSMFREWRKSLKIVCLMKMEIQSCNEHYRYTTYIVYLI